MTLSAFYSCVCARKSERAVHIMIKRELLPPRCVVAACTIGETTDHKLSRVNIFVARLTTQCGAFVLRHRNVASLLTDVAFFARNLRMPPVQRKPGARMIERARIPIVGIVTRGATPFLHLVRKLPPVLITVAGLAPQRGETEPPTPVCISHVAFLAQYSGVGTMQLKP